ncbi:MAG TPA: tetratricopeptide repeat protein [Leptospiraceae bacterium]|jgi:Tfp pilus assembly protein PilF|nr:tetratricopeptide repeat protein [Leptospirales bacterium]HMU82614.1 tetratricopeptide repeat protein [Leptospiraceae bacterium]HMW61370.1 tetratricopeptide repeat protein [Leptospiraceae bacterium]HMX54994.1 tetratricopeptide repeat protein [Leptospiraceae bacterium]HMZ36857.1 tetratricopeptide repeat protein [Leptospiraceae bacterium]
MLTKQQEEVVALYNQGLGLYKARKFKEARETFLKGLQILPEDGPSKLYVERCDAYIKDPPGEDWDGVYVMKTK